LSLSAFPFCIPSVHGQDGHIANVLLSNELSFGSEAYLVLAETLSIDYL